MAFARGTRRIGFAAAHRRTAPSGRGRMIPTCEQLPPWLWPRIDAGITPLAPPTHLRLRETDAVSVDSFGAGPGPADA